MNNTSEVINQILVAVLGSDIVSLQPDEIRMDSLDSWDSMRHLSIIAALENEFGIFIEASEAQELISYNQLIAFINNHPEID